MEFIFWVVCVLVALHLALYLISGAREKKNQEFLDSLIEAAQEFLVITLETVKQDQHEIILVHEFGTNKFLCQGADFSECEKHLTSQFPGRKILVVTEQFV